MKIILAHGTYIKPEVDAAITPYPDGSERQWIWGYRWNRNEQAWSRLCTMHTFTKYEWVEDTALPGRGNVVDIIDGGDLPDGHFAYLEDKEK